MIRLISCLFLAMTISTAIFAGTAKGTFELDGEVYTISAVQARTDENPFDKTKKDVLVLLTDKPVAETDFDVMTLDSMAESGELHGVLVRLEDARQATALTVLGVVQRSGNFVCAFDSSAFDEAHVSGRVYMKEPDRSFGRKYTFDVEFDAEVEETVPVAADEAGTPLPSDGGEPGKAYREYEKAILSGNAEALKKYLVPEQARKLQDPQAANMLGLMKMMRVREIRIVKGFLYGDDRAVLNLEGKDPVSNARTEGTAKMRNINGQWVLERESWSSSLN
jgi:hypothetical protein